MTTSNKCILYFMDSGQVFGGAVNTLLLQAILMKQHGHKVFVCFSSISCGPLLPAYCRMCTTNQIPLFCLPYAISSYTEGINIISLIDYYDILKNIIRIIQPDILHSVQINPAVELISRELKIPHIMNIYSALPAFFSLKYIDIWPKFMICDSNYWAKVWQKGIGLDSICIRTVVQESFVKAAVEKRPTRYICVGEIYTGEKNQLEVIKAFQQLISTGIQAQLDFYGDAGGSYAEKCRNYVSEYALDSHIVFHGYCEDMQNVYRNSDAIIVGSKRESYPNVVSESLAYSVIVISTPVGGVPEVIRDAYNGYLTNGYSDDAIFAKLIQFEEDKKNGLADTLIKNANASFMSEHSSSIVYEKLNAYYEYVYKEFSEQKAASSMLMISDVCKKFSSILRIYKENIQKFTSTDTTMKMIWYFFHVATEVKKLPSDSKVYIWGAGRFGLFAKENLEVFFPSIHLTGFIDSRKEGLFGSFAIEKPECVLTDDKSIVFIGASIGQRDIINTLEQYGKICHRTYFFLVPRRW